MKKLTTMTVMIWTLSMLSPIMPAAHAANIEDQVVGMLSNAPSSERVQELLAVKKDLETGNKAGILQTVAQMVVQKNGDSNIMGYIAGDNPAQAVEDKLKQEAEQRLEARLRPYQTQLGILAQLLSANSRLRPTMVKDNDSLAGAPQNYSRILNMTATAYAPGPKDNGKWGNQTFMGGTIHKGVVAVDPRVIPMGTRLWVEGYGNALAVDQGGAIKGNRIDLAFDKRSDALNYGIQKVKVYELN
jgi:3D (Asp-Asp-Asp) domain-containing protein